jgi:hypothetical protein
MTARERTATAEEIEERTRRCQTRAREAWPSCNGCGADIIGIGPGAQPWTVIVCDPCGQQSDGGAFCLTCMIELAKHGVRLHPVKR